MGNHAYMPARDEWMLIHPTHRFMHLFPAEHETVSLCGLPYVHIEANGEPHGTYVPLSRHPANIKYCPECLSKSATRWVKGED
jgi:hypothetical protein